MYKHNENVQKNWLRTAHEIVITVNKLYLHTNTYANEMNKTVDVENIVVWHIKIGLLNITSTSTMKMYKRMSW